MCVCVCVCVYIYIESRGRRGRWGRWRCCRATQTTRKGSTIVLNKKKERFGACMGAGRRPRAQVNPIEEVVTVDGEDEDIVMPDKLRRRTVRACVGERYMYEYIHTYIYMCMCVCVCVCVCMCIGSRGRRGRSGRWRFCRATRTAERQCSGLYIHIHIVGVSRCAQTRGSMIGCRVVGVVERAVDGEDGYVVVPHELRRGNVRVCIYIFSGCVPMNPNKGIDDRPSVRICGRRGRWGRLRCCCARQTARKG